MSKTEENFHTASL